MSNVQPFYTLGVIANGTAFLGTANVRYLYSIVWFVPGKSEALSRRKNCNKKPDQSLKFILNEDK